MNEIWLIVILGGLLTYLTRIAGHLLIARLETMPPRLEAALNAVPAAVLTTIVVPVFIEGQWPEKVAIVIAAILSLRLPLIATVVIGTGLVAGARAMGFLESASSKRKRAPEGARLGLFDERPAIRLPGSPKAATRRRGHA